MAHPVHPALVHFPVACWSLSTLGDIASLVYQDQRVWFVSGVLLVLGLVTALAAMFAGLFELRKISEESFAMRIAVWHMSLVVIVWGLYGLSLFTRLNGTALMPPGGIALGSSISGFLLLCVAGWLGGSLVYEQGIGVEAEESRKKVP
jgi:uncharacterized membrane protein